MKPEQRRIKLAIHIISGEKDEVSKIVFGVSQRTLSNDKLVLRKMFNVKRGEDLRLALIDKTGELRAAKISELERLIAANDSTYNEAA